MAESRHGQEGLLAEPKVGGGFPISPIWLFPIIALVIGGWLVYQTLSQKGPTITIAFESADGVEEGKTKIKFKEVEIGLVDTVEIKKDLSGVVITAEMKKAATPYLTDTTRFWVVRPRVGIRGISGLGTLVSGTFIEVDPGKGGKPKGNFEGLQVPPLVTTDEPGKEFTLITDKLGCVMPGETPAIFGDALRRLAGSATYLYQDGPRYWYSTQPTVTKLAEDRAEQLKREPDKVVQEIDKRLRADLVPGITSH